MGQLLFKKCFFDAIRKGTKRTTIRRWTSPRVRAGQRAWTPGLGWLTIDTVDAIDLKQLGLADARADGFKSVAEMLRMLKAIYPVDADNRRQWFRVGFRWEAKPE
jgi:hypothetical protein